MDLVVVIWEIHFTLLLFKFAQLATSLITSVHKEEKIEQHPSSEFSIPKFFYTNAESLNPDKVAEIETLARILKPTVLGVTEVHHQNIDLLNINVLHKYFKLRPDDHPLGKRGDGVVSYKLLVT